jgi:hypothetical protein
MGSSNYLALWKLWLASAGSPLDIHGFNFTAPGPARFFILASFYNHDIVGVCKNIQKSGR